MAPFDFSDVFHKRSAFGLLECALGGEFKIINACLYLSV